MTIPFMGAKYFDAVPLVVLGGFFIYELVEPSVATPKARKPMLALQRGDGELLEVQ